MSRNMKRRLENLESRLPKPQPKEESLDLSKFSPKEQEILKKANVIFEKFKRTCNPVSMKNTILTPTERADRMDAERQFWESLPKSQYNLIAKAARLTLHQRRREESQRGGEMKT